MSAQSQADRQRMMRAVSFRTPALEGRDVLQRDRDHFAAQAPDALAEAWWGSREGVQHVKYEGELLTAGQAVTMLDRWLS